MNQMPLDDHRVAKAKGAVLLICLLMLAALTLLGLAAASDHALQDRMSNNLVEAAHAGQSANSALKWGEQWLLGRTGSERPVACFDGCTQSDIIRAQGGHGPAPEHQDLNWWQLNAYATGKDPLSGAILDAATAGQNAYAYWLIEEIHLSSDTQIDDTIVETAYYRILARSPGRDPATGSSRFAVTQSIIARPWGDAAWTSAFPQTSLANSFCQGDKTPTPCGRLAWRQLH